MPWVRDLINDLRNICQFIHYPTELCFAILKLWGCLPFPSWFLKFNVLGIFVYCCGFLEGQWFNSSEWFSLRRLAGNVEDWRNRYFWKGGVQKWPRLFWLQVTETQCGLAWYKKKSADRYMSTGSLGKMSLSDPQSHRLGYSWDLP